MHRSTYIPVVLTLMVSPIALAHGPDENMQQSDGDQTTDRAPDPTALPICDGKVTDYPEAGNVFSCRQNFRPGGAGHSGPWFHGDTWNPLEKPHVLGSVLWPEASYEITELANSLLIEGNGLSVDQPTGIFPIARDDPAYAYDTDPNPILAQSVSFRVPLVPVMAAEPGCLQAGMIGFALTGVAFYNALDDAGLDAAAHEVQDRCNGHPQGQGEYHYHSSSPCLPGADSNALVGWALDGYPILGLRDEDGAVLSNADLDDCHGRAETVNVDGRLYDYAYRLTREYPYTLGCFTGRVPFTTRSAIR